MNAKKNRPSQARVPEIKRALSALGDIHPGSLSKQWNVCGKPDCRCKDPKHPKKHGPYYQISYTWRGKSHTVFAPENQAPEVKKQIANYRRFRLLCQQWVDAALEAARLKKIARLKTIRKI
jgi:hypothetical protein